MPTGLPVVRVGMLEAAEEDATLIVMGCVGLLEVELAEGDVGIAVVLCEVAPCAVPVLVDDLVGEFLCPAVVEEVVWVGVCW